MNKHWGTTTLGDLCELVTKGTTPTSIGFDFVEKGINFIKVESIDENKNFIPNKFAAISIKCHDHLKRSQLKKGDILFSIAGALGRTALVTNDILPANINQALAIIRLKPSKMVNTDFILLTLESGLIFEQINKFKGGVAQQNLSLEQVKSFRFPLPPLAEQQHIVAISNEAFTTIAKARKNTDKNLRNTKELFESYSQSLFTNKNKSWVEKTLGEVCEKITQGPNPKYDNNGVDKFRVLKTKNLYDKEIFYEDADKVSENVFKSCSSSELKNGDVLLAIVGQGSINKCNIFENNTPFKFIYTRALGLIRTKNAQLNPYYLRAYLQSAQGKKLIDSGIGGTSGQQVVTTTHIKALKISIPSIAEQKAIITKLNVFSTETKKFESIYLQKLADLKELKKSILQKAFNGELTGAYV